MLRKLLIGTLLFGIFALLIIFYSQFAQNQQSKTGMVFSAPEETVIVQFDGSKTRQYNGEKYARTTIEYRPHGYENLYKKELDTFKKDNNFRQAYPLFLEEDSHSLLIAGGNYLWALDLDTLDSKKLPKKWDISPCSQILSWDAAAKTLYAADVEDIGTTLFVKSFCKIDQSTGEIIHEVAINEEFVQLYPYYLDKASNKVIVEDFVISLNTLDIEKLKIKDWTMFTVYSYEFVDGNILLFNSAQKEFVTYNIRTEVPSKKFVLTDTSKTYFYVDVSPDFHYVLLDHFVRYEDGWKNGGNGYSCYLLVNLETFSEESEFCSKDIAKNGERKSFVGWVW